MKKTLKITLIFFSLIFIKLIFTYILNEYVILNYNKGNYKENLIEILKILNTNEPYIVYYNEGNLNYKQKEYEKAIENYDKALNKNPKSSRICDIRINQTLSMIKLINSQKQSEKLDLLKQARENLYEDGCANENDNNGKSENAEQLEEEIKDLEEKIKNGESQSNGNGNNDPNNTEEEIDDTEDSDIEQQLEEIEKQANANRQSDLDSLQESGDYHYYSGKRW